MSSRKASMTGDTGRGTLKKILEYIRQYRWAVILSLLLALLTVALTLYVPVLIGQAVDCVVAKGQVDFREIAKIIWKILVIVALAAAAQWLMNHIHNRITYRVVMDIRTKAFKHVERLPLRYLDSQPSGDILSRMIADVDQFSEGLLMGFTQLFTGVMTIGGTLAFMVLINPFITVVVVLLTPLSLFVASFIAKKTFTMFQRQ